MRSYINMENAGATFTFLFTGVLRDLRALGAEVPRQPEY